MFLGGYEAYSHFHAVVACFLCVFWACTGCLLSGQMILTKGWGGGMLSFIGYIEFIGSYVVRWEFTVVL